MTLSDWIEGAALILIFFLIAGIFRMVWALVRASQVQQADINVQAGQLWGHTERLAILDVLVDDHDTSLSGIHDALNEMSRLLAYAQETLASDILEADTDTTEDGHDERSDHPHRERDDRNDGSPDPLDRGSHRARGLSEDQGADPA